MANFEDEDDDPAMELANMQTPKNTMAPIVPATNASRPASSSPGVKHSNNQSSGYTIPPPSSGSSSGVPPTFGGNLQSGARGGQRGVGGPGAFQPGVNPTLGTEGSNLAPGVAPDSSVDSLYDEALRKLLEGGPRDTAGEEALLREQMLRDVGSGQANLNARMGASGFGTSGALSALGTDMRSKAAFDASKSIEGVRSNARDEYARDLQTGLGAVNQDRAADIEEAKLQAYIDAMNAAFGPEEGGGATPPGSTAPPNHNTGNFTNDQRRNLLDSNNDGQVSTEETAGFESGVEERAPGTKASSDWFNSGKEVSDMPIGTPDANSVKLGGGTDRNGQPKPEYYYNKTTGQLFRAA